MVLNLFPVDCVEYVVVWFVGWVLNSVVDYALNL